MHEAQLYTKRKNKFVQCHVCGWECVIANGTKGVCKTRINKQGKLYTLLYGKIMGGIQIDPIEKKPMYHFYPGSLVASIGSFGCNFRCKQCLNWQSTYKYDLSNLDHEITVTPKEVINEIVKRKIPGIAFTYNEPTIWIEFVHDCAKLAKEKNLYTIFVTNGFLTQKSLDYIGPYIDGFAVDFKGFSKQSYKRQGSPIDYRKVLDITKRAQEKWKMKIEVTTLIIPGINDDEKELIKIAKWIIKNLGKNTPWHLSQYSPSLAPDEKFQEVPATPVKKLKKIYQIGKDSGLSFVFVWASSSRFTISDTICSKCSRRVIERKGWRVQQNNTTENGNCLFCNNPIGIVV